MLFRESAFVYLYDANKKVHPFASSIQGVNTVLISKEGHLIAAVEKGRLKGISGAVEYEDGIFRTLQKELNEEIGYELDFENCKIYMVHLWIKSQQRDRFIADNFHTFLIKTETSTQEIMDGFKNRKDRELDGIFAFTPDRNVVRRNPKNLEMPPKDLFWGNIQNFLDDKKAFEGKSEEKTDGVSSLVFKKVVELNSKFEPHVQQQEQQQQQEQKLKQKAIIRKIRSKISEKLSRQKRGQP